MDAEASGDVDAEGAEQDRRAAEARAKGIRLLEEYVRNQAREADGADTVDGDGMTAEQDRRVEIILSMLRAGPDIERVIQEQRGSIDEPLLELLERRHRAALEAEGNSETAEGIRMLMSRLRVEMERARAPPALRLLDDVLSALVPEGGTGRGGREAVTSDVTTHAERRRMAAAAQRLREGWGLAIPGGNVIALSRQLDEGTGPELEAALVEPHAFFAAAADLERSASTDLAALERVMEELRTREATDGDDRGVSETLARAEAARDARISALGLLRQACELGHTVLAAGTRLTVDGHPEAAPTRADRD